MAVKFKSAVLEKVHLLKDEQEKVQKKTFTKWINSYLCRLIPPILVKDLMTDLKDGLRLLDLLEVMSNTTLPKEKPKIMQRIHCLTNIQTALAFMEKEKKVKLVNINASDVVDGKPAIVLGLVWTAILHFQIEEQEEYLLQALGMEHDPNAKVKGQARKGLMAWTNKTLEKYGLNITDFGESWSDGKAFSALVHNIDPSLVDMDSIEKMTNQERLENAFNIAETELGIAKLLDVEDVDVEKPDEKSIMTYVGQFLKSYPEGKRNEKIPTILELIKDFNEKVNKNCNNSKFLNNFEIFTDLMNQKYGIETKLNSFPSEDNSNIDKDEMELALDEFEKSNEKLKKWQWQLDKMLPGQLGSEIGEWLQKAEKNILESFPSCEEKNFNERILCKLKEHETIFNIKNDILKKFNAIKKHPPANVKEAQLNNIEKRLQDVSVKEEDVREKLSLFVLQSALKDKCEMWTKKINSWNSPINAENDPSERMKDFHDSTDNGKALDNYNNQLNDLIKRKEKLCKDNPDFEQNLNDFLNQFINECENESYILPEQFATSEAKLENLSISFHTITDGEKNIEIFLEKLRNVLQTDNLAEQKNLANQIPEMLDLITRMKQVVEEELTPHCSARLLESIEKKVNEYDENIQIFGEKLVNQIEVQEEQIKSQQKAAYESMIEDIIVNNEQNVKDVTDWISKAESCLEPTIKRSLEELNQILEILNNLNLHAPEIQNQINRGYQTVLDLKNHNEKKTANQIKKLMDELQTKFTSFKEKEIPKSLDNINTIINTVKNIENKITELNEFIEESKAIKDFFDNSQNVNDSINVIVKEKEFLAKEKEIVNSIKNDRDLLKKLNEISTKSQLNIDLKPIENKIASSESILQETLKMAKEHVSAMNQCTEACEKATNFLENLSKNLSTNAALVSSEDNEIKKMSNFEIMEEELVKADQMIKEVELKKNSARRQLLKGDCDKVDNIISEMKNKSNDLRKLLQNSKNETSTSLRNWNDFKKVKELFNKDYESIVNDLRMCHERNGGIHGGNCNEKSSLLKENMKRLDDLNKQENRLKELLKIANTLGSQKPILEIETLRKKLDNQKEELKKEIQQNKTDLENHQKLENDMTSLNEWLTYAEDVGKKIKSMPNNKQSLVEKQKRLEELEKLNLVGNEKIKDLKKLTNIVIDQTSNNSKNKINIDKQINQFNSIFEDVESLKNINKEAIEKIDKIDENLSSILQNVNEIANTLSHCSNLPKDSIGDKEKMGKELRNLDRSLDIQRSLLNNLKNECSSVTENSPMKESMRKIDNINDQCFSIKSEINEKLKQNDNDLKYQSLLEKKLNEFDYLMSKICDELSHYSQIDCNEASVEEYLKKLKQIKSKHTQGKDILNDLLKYSGTFEVPKQTAKLCDDAEEKFIKVEDEVLMVENRLLMQKNEWSNFNLNKDNLEKWIDEVYLEMEKIIRQNGGALGGKIKEKEILLDKHRNLLQEVLNHETDINTFIERFTPLLSPLNQDSSKRTTNSICKKYENILETLTNVVRQNEDDLHKHENYVKELDKFVEENKLIIQKINNEVTKLPNTKEGLKQKINVYENLEKIYNHRKDNIVNLEKSKNDVVNHSASNCHSDLEHEWNQIVDSFEKCFNPSIENQSKLKVMISKLEKTESDYKELSSKLLNIENRQNTVVSLVSHSTKDMEKKLQSLKEIQSDLKGLQGSINDQNRRHNQNCKDFNLANNTNENLLNKYKLLTDSIKTNLEACERQYMELSNISSDLSTFKTWLDQTDGQIEDQSKLTNFDTTTVKKNIKSLRSLRDDIAEHKVILSRLQSSIESSLKISDKSNSFQRTLRGLLEAYDNINNRCQNELDKNNVLNNLMDKYEASRANILHWIETNTQILLKCSDYTLNQEKIKSKLLIIESLEKDVENNAQSKFIEAIQDSEDLINELSGLSRDLIVQQTNDLKSDWTEICRQLSHLSTNLKNTASRSEIFKDMCNQLSSWLEDIEHIGLMDPLSIEHQCEIPQDERSNNNSERLKTLLTDVYRHKQDFLQLSNMASNLANPSFDIENTQIQNRYTRLTINLKEKIDKISKQQADYDLIKQDLEEMEKWIFQTSMKIINENTEQGSNSKTSLLQIEELIQHNNDTIASIMSKEPNILSLHDMIGKLLNSAENQSPERNQEIQEDLDKLHKNYNNLKETAIHKRDHLLESIKKWETYQNLLTSAKAFLTHYMVRWWKEKSESPVKTEHSNNESDNEYKEILEIENKLNGFKKGLENAAKNCDGILPQVTTALSRTQTVNYRNSMTSTTPNVIKPNNQSPILNENSIVNLMPKAIYDDLETNLKRLLELKNENEDKNKKWNIFNRERNSFKNWLDNETMKIKSIVESAPGSVCMDSFHKTKLKLIQDELDYKKSALSNINNKFNDLTSKNKTATDSILKEINRDYGAVTKQIHKLLNREDKEVEANFSDEDQSNGIFKETKVPKLNLSDLDNENQYEVPEKLSRSTQFMQSKDETDNKKQKVYNFPCQTSGSKTSQTDFKKKGVNSTQTVNKQRILKENKEECFCKILNSIRDINHHLKKSADTAEFNHNQSSLRSKKSQSPHPESIRRNVLSSSTLTNRYPSVKRSLAHRYSSDLKPQQTPFTKLYPSFSAEYSSQFSNSKTVNNDIYSSRKEKWLNSNFSPRMNFNLSNNPSHNIQTNNFQIDYTKDSGYFTERPPLDYPYKSRSFQKSANLKNSRIKESFDRISQDANELGHLSDKLRNY